MPASLVQSSSLVVGGYPSASTSFSTTPTVGGTVLVTGTYSPSFGTAPTGVSITDNQGNTYSVLRSVSSIGDSGAFIGYAAIGTASGTFTVTATVTGGSADAGVMVSAQEWSGLDNTGLLDQQGAATLAFGTGTDQTVTASGANAAADRVVIGVLSSRNSASISSVQNSPPITGYTNIYSRLTVGFGEPGGLAAYKVVSATETSSVNWGEVTGGGFISALQLATFVVAAGGGTTHDTTGVLTGQAAAITGAAARTRAHPSSGALTGPGSSVVGSAARTRAHPTSGVLTGQGSLVAGIAARTRAHPTSGALTGQSAAVTGSAARTRVHPSSGDLVGQGSAIVGSADHQSAAGTHDTTGSLVGQGSEIAGSANRVPNHSTSGALVAQGSLVTGSAARFRAFATSGALTGQGSAIAGSAARVAGPVTHAATGALVGAGSAVNGSAARTGPAVTHDTSGVLVGPGSLVAGVALNGILPDTPFGGGFFSQALRRRLFEEEMREKLRELPQQVAEVIGNTVIESIDRPKKPTQKELRQAFERENIPYREAYRQAVISLVQEMRQAEEEEEEEATALALLI